MAFYLEFLFCRVRHKRLHNLAVCINLTNHSPIFVQEKFGYVLFKNIFLVVCKDIFTLKFTDYRVESINVVSPLKTTIPT